MTTHLNETGIIDHNHSFTCYVDCYRASKKRSASLTADSLMNYSTP